MLQTGYQPWSRLQVSQPEMQNLCKWSRLWTRQWFSLDGDISSFQGIDGISQWKVLQGLEPHVPRESFLYNIDENYNNSAVRYGKWKLIQGKEQFRKPTGPPINYLFKTIIFQATPHPLTWAVVRTERVIAGSGHLVDRRGTPLVM